jgi:Histidyl-tRNA synthetase
MVGVVRVMEELTAQYGWRRVQTPVFEDTGLFARTSGEASDVVNKEMYTFTDRSDRSLTLRPEGTAPIARAYIEHGMHREPQPVKAYTIASMYRYGAPGRGATASTTSSPSRRSAPPTPRSTPK